MSCNTAVFITFQFALCSGADLRRVSCNTAILSSLYAGCLLFRAAFSLCDTVFAVSAVFTVFAVFAVFTVFTTFYVALRRGADPRRLSCSTAILSSLCRLAFSLCNTSQR